MMMKKKTDKRQAKLKKKKKTRYIYLMKTYGKSYFKIGQAIDPEQRRMNLQSGCPYPLDIRPRLYGEKLSRERGSPSQPSQLQRAFI